MKAHKNDDIHTRVALLEQSQEHTIAALQDIKYQIQNLSSDIKLDVNQLRNDIKVEFRDFRKEVSEEFRIVRKETNERFAIVENRFQRLENRMYQVMFLISSSVIGYMLAKMFHYI